MKSSALPLAVDHAGAALAAMFAARKRVFIDQLGWDLPVRDGRFEVDQFDGVRARYLLLDGAAMGHRASARLLSTETPHILGDLFPSLCEGPVPRGGDVCEITRFCIDPDLARGEQRHARNELVSALVRHAASTGVTTYTAVAGLAWFRQISRFGWDCSALGEPRNVKGETLVGLRITIDTATADRLAARHIWREPRFSVLRLEEGALT